MCDIRGRRSETTNKSDRIDADWLSEQLRLGALRVVHHGTPGVATLKELVRCHTNLVEDATRVMLRVKAIYRGRAIATTGKTVYRPSQRKEWLARLESPGARARAALLLEQLDKLLELKLKARAAVIGEARRQPGWKILRSIPSGSDAPSRPLAKATSLMANATLGSDAPEPDGGKGNELGGQRNFQL